MDKTTITVEDLFDTNLIGAFQRLMRLSLPYQTSRALVKLAELFDKEKQMANDYLAKNFEGKNFGQLKQLEEAKIDASTEEDFKTVQSFREFYKQEIKLSPVPMSELKNANVEPIVLKILTGKILVED